MERPIAHKDSRRPARITASDTCARGPTALAPTAKLNASSKRCCASGPTPPSTRPASNAPLLSHRGWTTTTNDDPTAPSVTSPQPRGSPPHDQRPWELHLEVRLRATWAGGQPRATGGRQLGLDGAAEVRVLE